VTQKTRRRRQLPPHLRIKLVGCGIISSYLARPLCSYLRKNSAATFEIRAIDGNGEASARLVWAADGSPGVAAGEQVTAVGGVESGHRSCDLAPTTNNHQNQFYVRLRLW
jgi:hypothetical protein